MKFRSKVLLCFLCAILVPSMIAVAVMYSGSSNILKEKVDALAQKSLDSVRLVIQQRLAFVDELTTFISMNPAILEVLSSKPSDSMSANILEILSLDHALDSYYLSNYYATNSSPIVPVIYLLDKPAYQKYDISPKVRDISAVEGTSWYPRAAAKNTATSFDGSNVIITRHLYNLQNVDTAQYAALLSISLEKSFFSQLLGTYKSTPDTKVVLMSSLREVIATSDELGEQELVWLQSIEPTTDGTLLQQNITSSLVVSALPLTNIDWYLVSITDFDAVNAGQISLTRIVSVLLLLCVCVAVLAAVLLSRNLSRPITALVQSMGTMRHGNFEPDIEYNKADEFGYLIGQYKEMMREIQQLIEDLYVSEGNKQRAEITAKDMQLKALQAQINPHFLYNTLDSINLYAIKYNVPKISEMVSALADFFRYSLSKGASVITLEEELRHTRAYLELQQMRYGPKLKYSFTVPSELRHLRMVKLTLQPLVENSVLHGLVGQVQQLEIGIAARREVSRIVIEVSDNGAGADAESLNQMLSTYSEESSGSFAINNVHQRLRTLYGTDYGLHYRNNNPCGLVVEINIPTTPQITK